jgi:ribosomal protein L9
MFEKNKLKNVKSGFHRTFLVLATNGYECGGSISKLEWKLHKKGKATSVTGRGGP